MFPILWRYLLQGYLKVFVLSVCTFVSVLIVSRFKEIARFAALCGDWLKTCLFLLYQIPFTLPLAIPISALVASFLLFQRLSRSYELVALRASGQTFRALISPLLIASLFLACLNFSCSADLSPYCRRESKALLYRETSSNPLLLVQRQNLVQIKHAYLKMDVKKESKEAHKFILIAHNESNDRLNLFSARRLKIAKSTLVGYDLSMLTHLNSAQKEEFDPLLVENEAEMSTAAPVLSAALKKNRPKLEANSLSLRMLRLRMHEEGKLVQGVSVEIMRRVSLSLAVLTFTLLGCAFGIQPNRTPSKKGVIYSLLLTIPVLLAYLSIKTLKSHLPLAFFFTLIPHLLIVFFSFLRINAIARGKI